MSKHVMYLKNKQYEQQFAKSIQHFLIMMSIGVRALRMVSDFRMSSLTVMFCTAKNKKRYIYIYI